jgi:hypothetical protein
MDGKTNDIREWMKSEWPAHIPRIGDSQRSIGVRLRVREGLNYLASILALAGVLVYALVSIAYDAFYRPLDVDPADVGISYGKVLAQSTGMVVFNGLLMVIVVGLTLLVVFLVQRIIRWRKRRILPLHRTIAKVVLAGVLLEGILLPGILEAQTAGEAATMLKSGRPVVPSGQWITLLPVRAEPVLVEPINEAVARAISAQLDCNIAKDHACGEELFYLGQVDGIAVLYNAAQQRKMYLPLSSVILHVSNCRTRLSRDISCRDVFLYE